MFVTTCILLVFICGNYLCEGNLRTVAYVFAQNTRIIPYQSRPCRKSKMLQVAMISATQPRHMLIKFYRENLFRISNLIKG